MLWVLLKYYIKYIYIICFLCIVIYINLFNLFLNIDPVNWRTANNFFIKTRTYRILHGELLGQSEANDCKIQKKKHNELQLY